MVRSNWATVTLWLQGIWLFLLMGSVTVGVTWAGTHPRELNFERACIEAKVGANRAAAAMRLQDLIIGFGFPSLRFLADDTGTDGMTARLVMKHIAEEARH